MLQITTKELRSLLAADPTLRIIDVRTPEEFSEGAIPGAINIPTQVVAQRMEEFKSAQPTYVICHSGSRSKLTVLTLEAAGIKNLYNVAGGMMAWTA